MIPDRSLKEEMLEKALDLLREHFDDIQILATVHEGDSTFCSEVGCGNMMSRICHAGVFHKREFRMMIDADDEFLEEDWKKNL